MGQAFSLSGLLPRAASSGNPREADAEALSVSVELRAKPVPIRKFLSERAWRKLRSFSGSSNRYGPHPSDSEQWSAFLALAHLDRTTLTSDRLYDWLTKAQRWPKDPRMI